MASEDPSSLEPGNPYQSPRTDADARRESKQPSSAKFEWLAKPLPLNWLWECLALGLLICVGPQYEDLLALARGSAIALTSIIPQVLFGVTTGLGFALLLNHANREMFARLQPGHWQLIVTMLALVRFLLEVFVFEGSTYQWGPAEEGPWISFEVPSLIPQVILFTLTTIFYILILRTTQEIDVWRWYAWIATVVFGTTAVAKTLLLTQLIDIDGPAASAYSPQSVLVLGLASIATYGPYLLALLMVCGVIRDLGKNIPRDVYHYLGIVLVAIHPGIQWWMDYLAYHLRFGPLN